MRQQQQRTLSLNQERLLLQRLSLSIPVSARVNSRDETMMESRGDTTLAQTTFFKRMQSWPSSVASLVVVVRLLPAPAVESAADA